MKNINILISSICFINRNKPGSEIYATFANRLINDVMTKSPYDVQMITNEPELFEEVSLKWGSRVIIKTDLLESNRLSVGPFNQLLKYKTIENISSQYDWVLYLDCDAGFTNVLEVSKIEEYTKRWESIGYNMLGTRTEAVLKTELLDHERKKEEFIKNNPQSLYNPWNYGQNLFSAKFVFYDVSSENGPHEWMDAKLPSEHIFYVKNNEKLKIMAEEFKKFCKKFETQNENSLITWDMEAFEIGVSAKIAGYTMGDFGNDGLYLVWKVQCNFNNWEKKKY